MIKSIHKVIFSITFSCFLLTACAPVGVLVKKGDVEALSDSIWHYGLSHPEGFTIDIRTMTEPVEGIAVSYSATQGCHSRNKLGRVVKHSMRHDGYVGGWFDAADSLYYFDSTRIFPKDSIDAAKKFGLENGQKAIFDITEKKEIRLN